MVMKAMSHFDSVNTVDNQEILLEHYIVSCKKCGARNFELHLSAIEKANSAKIKSAKIKCVWCGTFYEISKMQEQVKIENDR